MQSPIQIEKNIQVEITGAFPKKCVTAYNPLTGE